MDIKIKGAAIMFQGTGSDVGKSAIVAGICRALTNRGFKVAPFKPQNMSNNAAITQNGGEIGRAQALQAIACKCPATNDMNPILLKPQSNYTTQLIVNGKALGNAEADYFRRNKHELLDEVINAFERLKATHDFVIIEGAGSPAETNLRANDIANMGFATRAKVPVVLIGDIDRGGVIASLIGTRTVLSDEDCSLVKGFIINKFRGHLELFNDGYHEIAARTGFKALGVLPWSGAVRKLPAEDAVVLQDVKPTTKQKIKIRQKIEIAIPLLPRIANFDDFDALRQDENIRLTIVRPNNPIPQSADWIIIPGSKATIADLKFLYGQGWDIDIKAHVRAGKSLVGICGGYQMLGKTISDPHGIEGDCATIDGLGLLNCETVLEGDKTTREIRGYSLLGRAKFSGYEIHLGKTIGYDKPLLRLENGKDDGAISDNGLVMGCYIHGLFDDAGFRQEFFGFDYRGLNQKQVVENALDELAGEIEKYLNLDEIIEIAKAQNGAIK